jgi:hypothetical protein
MRVALFFDGKNHMKDLRRTAQDRWLDHGALADWIVKHVGGTRFAGAYYYTASRPRRTTRAIGTRSPISSTSSRSGRASSSAASTAARRRASARTASR